MSAAAPDWAAIRSFVHNKRINFNAGSCSPALKPIADLLQQRQQRNQSDPIGYVWDENLRDIERSRQSLAEYLVCDGHSLLLYKNATIAFAVAMNSLQIKLQGQQIEVLITDEEYSHVEAHLRRANPSWQFKVVKLPNKVDHSDASSETIVEAFKSAWTADTKMVFCSHISSVSGLVLPIKELCALAADRGAISFIDGAHGPGMLPVNLQEIAPDFYFANCHKWMMGCISSAFLYVDRSWHESMWPLVQHTLFPPAKERFYEELMEAGPSCFAYGLEYQGTEDRTAQGVVAELIDLRRSWGEGHLQKRALSVRQKVSDALAAIGLQQHSLDDPGLCSSMVSFRLPKVEAYPALTHLRQHHNLEVQIPAGERPYSLLRISAAWWIGDHEVEKLVAILDSHPLEQFT